MTENIVVILGSLAIFAFVTISVIALVYNRAIRMRASDKALEIETTVEERSDVAGVNSSGDDDETARR